ncbi:Cell division protein FtsQ [Candidatus Rhodobacter oscarellae]|uniref:Cell division protein FtsQ n=1 Tax=Candidatus Rhodobacter oscarellae TaxID=1675527 RepID=A0A0J9GY68_9RHOB|nr:cell division protein FtsQ/DivIB [Candidatus Rhodobacter lobularis]KMW58418.1 Cell division protein FtsQ [Candidatus Rhodobacter lobularis]
MQPVNPHDAARRDPAPSRLSYRVQRWWLTPNFRRMVRYGLPIASIALALLWVFSVEENRAVIEEQIAEIRRAVAERPEFMVKAMAVDGASEELGEDIREVLPVDFPISSFDLELQDMKAVVEQLDAVAQAELRIKAGGILQLEVTERMPAIVWRNRGTLELLDETGRRVAAITHRSQRRDLPLIVGEGADQAVPEALALFAAATPLEPRLRGLVRMGERRWDVALDRQQRILLPEQGAVQTLQQVMALDQAKDVLDRNIIDFDMRDPARPTLRLAAPAVEDLHRIRALEIGGSGQ